jgi:hypothetical protein
LLGGFLEQVFEGGGLHLAAVFELGPGEADIVVLRRLEDRRFRRTGGLHQHAPSFCAASRPTRHLGDELERSLGRSQIGLVQHRSASITPTRVTLGKSSPLEIICVPSRIRVSPCRNASSARSWLPGLRIESLSMRTQEYFGNRARTSCSRRCVPMPMY